MMTKSVQVRGPALIVILFVLTFTLMSSGPVMGLVVPSTVKIQGFLTDRSGGSPVPANGIHSILFEVFDTQVGGLLQASVGPLSVSVNDGLYEAELPILPAVFAGTPRYMQITVNGELLSPRLLMASVPYAFHAEEAGKAATVAPGSVDSSALADDAVTEDKIGIVCPSPGDVMAWDGTGWACSGAGSAMVCPAGSFINCYSGPIGTLGVGTCQPGLSFCKASGEGFDSCTGEVLPAAETCDGLDNDCDGATDQGNPGGGGSCSTGLPGICAAGAMTCSGGSLVCQPVQPAEPEICDGLDNDCDGTVDEGCTCTSGTTQPCGMNVGVCQEGIETCVGGMWGACVGDVGPQAEMCDGLDNDCDGTTDEGNPGGGGSCSTGLQGVCAVGTTSCTAGTLVCQQDQSSIPEVCDGLDNDCDGTVDEGNPGGGGSCSTGLPGICASGTSTCSGGTFVCNQNMPAEPEVCDGVDNNCDGTTDEGNPGGGGSCSTGLPGVCDAGFLNCDSGALTCNQVQTPTAETCDNLDNDCDGTVDEGNPGGGGSCNTGLLGVCAAGSTTCSAGGLVCQQDQSAGTEVCDGLDNDCDGSTDEGGVC